MPSSNGFVGKTITILILFAVLMWVVKDPHNAALAANHAVAFVQRVLTGLLTFFTEVTS